MTQSQSVRTGSWSNGKRGLVWVSVSLFHHVDMCALFAWRRDSSRMGCTNRRRKALVTNIYVDDTLAMQLHTPLNVNIFSWRVAFFSSISHIAKILQKWFEEDKGVASSSKLCRSQSGQALYDAKNLLLMFWYLIPQDTGLRGRSCLCSLRRTYIILIRRF